jgi:GNAT superfamily N-acetyltransferase
MTDLPERKFALTTMTRAEVQIAIDWAAAEGWNPGLDDAAAFWAADPDGFFITRINGEPVGVRACVRYGSSLAFCGLLIVKEEFRGQHISMAMTHTALGHAAGRTIGLDGVVAMQDKYAEIGYRYAHRNLRYQGQGGGSMPDGLIDLDELMFAEIAAYDEHIFTAPRQAFLKQWLSYPNGMKLGCIRNGELVGYGVLRPCRVGHKIGPLFANDAETAERLFAGLASIVPGKPIFFDPPETNEAAVRLAESHGMSVMFETARMYRGPAPKIPLEKVFGITSFELG